MVSIIKDLFREIKCSDEPVRNSTYISRIGLHNYVPGIQYDAHECMLQLLTSIYPDISANF